MSTQRIDPAWGDDLLAIAEAVGVTAPSGRPHPTVDGDLSDLVLALALETWARDHADDPIPLLPTVHEPCSSCGVATCGCDDRCTDLAASACDHLSRPYCPDCAFFACDWCRMDQLRWDAPKGGEDR